ncbi:UNVERIFIED_CONTAM: Maltose excess protein 1, chloroplastic [Sesamum radiatum]|uniref:Maltose excess protein 1, chloroplastic n=1 Tax=Sesamum radiatum TaxID=300843 RepID=A0AAW2Q0D2_SESRA
MYTRNRRSGSIVIGAVPLVLKACASFSLLSFGKVLHSEIVKSGVECDVMVGTALVDMYGKCQDIVSSRKVFDHMPERNAVTWNAMICGYMRNGDTKLASILFENMARKKSVTWNEMIDGYANNGDIAMARQVFESVPEGLKNVGTWTIMVEGYVSNGDMKAAREVFEKMPVNFYVWSVMITGYFKEGDVLKAREIFDAMSMRSLVIWNSMISGYAQNRMCRLQDAFNLVKEMPMAPNDRVLGALLGACRIHSDTFMTENVLELRKPKLVPFCFEGNSLHELAHPLSATTSVSDKLHLKEVLFSGQSVCSYRLKAISSFSSEDGYPISQIVLNTQNLLAGNKSALLAVPWLVIWSTFVPYVPNTALPGFIAFVTAVFVVLMGRISKLSDKGVKFLGLVSGWTATLLFMWMAVAQMIIVLLLLDELVFLVVVKSLFLITPSLLSFQSTNLLNPDNIKGISAVSMLLAMIGNGLIIPRALFIRDFMWHVS